MLGEVAVCVSILGNGEAHGRSDQPVWFIRCDPAHHEEEYLSWIQFLHALLLRHHLAVGREYTGHGDEVARLDARVAQRQLEAREPLLVLTNSLRKKDLFWDECRHFLLD